MPEKGMNNENKDRTGAVNLDKNEKRRKQNVTGDEIDDDVSEIDDRIMRLIRQFDDGAQFDENRHHIVPDSANLEELEDKNMIEINGKK